MLKVNKIYKEVLKSKGFTSGQPKRYVVGGASDEILLKSSNLKNGLKKAVKMWKKELSNNKALHLGVWLNDDNKLYYVELSKSTDNLEAAILQGKALKQIAIYDTVEEKEIILKY